MNRLIPILLTVILLFTVHFVLAQGIWKTYTTADGLAGNNVRSIAQDKEGNMWFGTWGNGLSKLDTNGVWTNFMNTDSTVYILDIEIDSLNNKWLALAQHGAGSFFNGSYVVRFDDCIFTYYCPQGDPYYSLISPISMGQDSLGNIWCGTIHLAYWFDGRDWHPWYVAGTGPVSKVNEIKTDRHGKLYFAHDRGIATLYDWLYTYWTTDLAFDKQNRMWFGGFDYQGLGRYDGLNWHFYTINDGLFSLDIGDIAVDSSNNIWMSQGLIGVAKFEGKTFTHFTHEHGLAHDRVWDIYVDRKGDIWFATRGGVSVFHDTTTTRVNQETESSDITKTFSLFHSYPNPLNTSTIISYLLPTNNKIRLSIYNLMGKEVNQLINEEQNSGDYQVIWNGKDNHGKEVSSGLYIAVLESDNLKKSIKLTLIR